MPCASPLERQRIGALVRRLFVAGLKHRHQALLLHAAGATFGVARLDVRLGVRVTFLFTGPSRRRPRRKVHALHELHGENQRSLSQNSS